MNGYKILHNDLSAAEFEDLLKLRSDRYKRAIGSGATAKVYAFPQGSSLKDGWVYRIQKSSYDYSAHPYLQFAKACLKSKSRHFPKLKFLAIKKGCYGDVAQVVSVIERLEDWRSHYNEAPYYWTDDVEAYLNDRNTLPRSSKSIRDKKGYTPSSIRHVRHVFDKHEVSVNDLHGDNVMARKDGTIVITDPSA